MCHEEWLYNHLFLAFRRDNWPLMLPLNQCFIVMSLWAASLLYLYCIHAIYSLLEIWCTMPGMIMVVIISRQFQSTQKEDTKRVHEAPSKTWGLAVPSVPIYPYMMQTLSRCFLNHLKNEYFIPSLRNTTHAYTHTYICRS